MKYLITGTGGCGTMYAAKVLQEAGVPCSWETFFQHDGLPNARKRLNGKKKLRRPGVPDIRTDFSATGIEAESSHLAAPFLDMPELRSTKVIHLVREPMRTVSSLQKMNRLEGKHSLRKLALTAVPEVFGDHLQRIDRYAFYYVCWNEMIERLRPDAILHKVEDGSERLLRKLGVDFEYRPVWKAPINSHTSVHLSFDEVKDPVVREAMMLQSRRYGYC